MLFWRLAFLTTVYWAHVLSRRTRPRGELVMQRFKCDNNESIPYSMFCDEQPDCSDSSDEKPRGSADVEFNPLAEWQNCNNPENPAVASCLVNRTHICRGDVICRGVTPCDLKCETHYLCQNSVTCVRRRTVCNGDPCDGCKEDHEWRNGAGFKCFRNGRECVLPQQLLYDDISDCDGGVDRCFQSDFPGNAISESGVSFNKENFNRQLCFQCLDNAMIIPASRICDGVVDCSDLSDECLCEDDVPEICEHVITYGVTISKEDESEEMEVGSGNDSSIFVTTYPSHMEFWIRYKRSPVYTYTECGVGHVRCSDGKCILRENVCDGLKHCEEDESYAICLGTIRCMDATALEEVCRCWPERACRHNFGTACNGVTDCPVPAPANGNIITDNKFPEDECMTSCTNEENKNFTCIPSPRGAVSLPIFNYKCRVNRNGTEENINITYIKSTLLCNGKIDCPLGDDEENCTDRFSCSAKRRGFMSISSRFTCDGAEDCRDGSDETQELCGAERFRCAALGGLKVNIDKTLVCDFSITCDDASDEMNCADGRFYCENGKPLFVRGRQIFDGRGDCSDWSDECPKLKSLENSDDFSSRYELIASPVLRAFIWIMGLLSIFGNSVVIYREGKKLRDPGLRKALIIANRLLVLNLAVSDVIMGIYLISLGATAVQMQGSYCSQDLEWRSSPACTTLGILTVISSETSVITMVFLAGCRLYAVIRPFKTKNNPRKLHIILMLLSAWATSFFIALLPLAPSLSSIFISSAQFSYNPFMRKVETSLDGARNLYRNLVTYDLGQNISIPDDLENFIVTSSWGDLEKSAKVIFAHDNFRVEKYFGYYSTHSVCIPKFFVTTSDSAWGFSFFVNFFNFLAFTFVASAYIMIQTQTRQKASIIGKGSKKKDAESKKLQRKILRLIITDFCCWMPICIMAFCKLAGAEVGNTAYAVSAIILLPINSALNPLLYSDVPDALHRKFQEHFKPTSDESSAPNSANTSGTNVNRSKGGPKVTETGDKAEDNGERL